MSHKDHCHCSLIKKKKTKNTPDTKGWKKDEPDKNKTPTTHTDDNHYNLKNTKNGTQ